MLFAQGTYCIARFQIKCFLIVTRALQVVLVVKNPLTNAGDIRHADLIPRMEKYPGGEHGNPLQYSCLENPKDKGAWWAMVHSITKSRTRLSDFTFFFNI